MNLLHVYICNLHLYVHLKSLGNGHGRNNLGKFFFTIAILIYISFNLKRGHAIGTKFVPSYSILLMAD